MSEEAEATIEADAEITTQDETSAENLKGDYNNHDAKEHKNSENFEDEKNLEEYDKNNSYIKEIYHDDETITYAKGSKTRQISLRDSKNAASEESLEEKLSSKESKDGKSLELILKKESDEVNEKDEGTSKRLKWYQKGLEDYLRDLIEKQQYWIRELYYIATGFLHVEDNENPFAKVDRIAEYGKPIIAFIPGLGHYPISGRDFEEYSGFPTIRIPRGDIDKTWDMEKTDEFFKHIMKKTGVGPIVIGYSDGEKTFHKYLQKYGDSKISMFYGLDSDKGKIEKLMDPNRVIYINGQGILVRGFEDVLGGKYDAETNRPVYTIENATHAGLVHNPYSIQKVSEIIASTSKRKARYNSFEPDVKMLKKAA